EQDPERAPVHRQRLGEHDHGVPRQVWLIRVVRVFDGHDATSIGLTGSRIAAGATRGSAIRVRTGRRPRGGCACAGTRHPTGLGFSPRTCPSPPPRLVPPVPSGGTVAASLLLNADTWKRLSLPSAMT